MSTATAPPKAPVGLSPRARSLWAAVQRDYQLEEHHQALLIEACRTLTRLDAVTKALDAAPAVTTGSTGQLRGNPLFTVERDLRVLLARLLRELNLDQAAEPDVRVPRVR